MDPYQTNPTYEKLKNLDPTQPMGQPNPQTTLVWCMRCGLITLLCGALFSRLSAVNFNAVSRHRRDFVVSPASDGGVWHDVRQETGSFRSRASRKHDVSNQHWRKQLAMEHSSLLTAIRPGCDGHSTTCFRLRRYGDLTVFRMAAIRHLWFLKCNFFTMVKRPMLHHRANFREDRSIRCWDIVILWCE